MSITTEIRRHLGHFETAPILFIGSGLSRRYLGLEDWESLLKRFSAFTSKPFQQYKANSNSDYPKLATLLAQDLNDIWWDDPRFEESRANFMSICESEDSALKIEISKYLQDNSNPRSLNDSLQKEINTLKNVVIDGIITTNWDLYLESLFPDFKVYIGQDQLLFNHSLSLAEIFKIHGCCSNPNSLILTTKDYEKFENKNPYLAAKLITFFIEHPIIFLGYSLTDQNIKDILHSIAMCLTKDNISKLQDRLIFVEWDSTKTSPEFLNSNIILDGSSIPIKSIKANDFTPIYEAISDVKRRFPAPLLRKLKDQVYDLVLHNDPKGKLFVQDISKVDDVKDFEVVFGVGAISIYQKVGYSGIEGYDLMRDVVFDSLNLDPKGVVESTLPKILKSNHKFVPCFKYLNKGNYFSEGGMDALDHRIIDRSKVEKSFFENSGYYKRKSSEITEIQGGLESLFAKLGDDGILGFATFIPEDKLDLNLLLKFLKDNFDKALTYNSLDKTSFKRLVCLYDYLMYSNRAELVESELTE